ncbi:MAG: DUF4330 domain-containing protein [Rubrobacteridae bacterium]|nr:DUF4330 domain-containing protein [Rubrobacteridae bacterium]
MAVIDEKGRIFGRINLIDFTLVLGIVVVAAIALVFLTKQGKVVTVKEDKTIEYTMLVKAIRPEVAGFIKKGDLVKKQLTKNPIGIVKNIDVKQAQILIDTADGKRLTTISLVEVDARVTIETKGRTGEDIISTGNEVLRVGDRFNIVTKWFIGDAVIVGMDVSGEKAE